MKRYITSTTDASDLRKKISNSLYEFIQYELWPQKDYYKGIRKQFTVNGRKYVVKNDAKGRLHVITPEGEDLYGYTIPDHLTPDSTDSIALDIINDAYGDDVDTYNKRVQLSVRSGYTRYGSNSGGVVSFGPYMDALRRHYPEGSYRRYAVVTIKAWWSGNVEDCVWFDDIDDAIDYAKDFIDSGEQSRSGHDSSIGDYKYRYYANVIDSESGEEVFSDAIEQRE